MRYDELYGLNLKEYIEEHDTTIEKLISKVEIDIRLLEKSLKKRNVLTAPNSVIYTLTTTIDKKVQHKDRLLEWARDYDEDE